MSAQPLLSASTPRAFWSLLIGLALLALVPTLWPTLDLQSAAVFSAKPPLLAAVNWPWVVLINGWLPAIFRVGLLLALTLWLVSYTRWVPRHWRLTLAFITLAGTLGPGAVVNYGFKDNWQRARPYQVSDFGGTAQFTRAGVMTDQCEANCSFVSGHVACGFFLASLALVHRRRAKAWVVAGAVSGAAVGFCRMADSAHWLSDVLWAGPITLLTSWLVWLALLTAQGRSPAQLSG